MTLTECASVRGRWGEICPDCGQRLPNPPAIASWKSQLPLEFTSGASAGLGTRSQSKPRHGDGREPYLPVYHERTPDQRKRISEAMRASWARRKVRA